MNPKKLDKSNSPRPRLRALILEDNPQDAKLSVALLKRGGYEPQFEVVDSPRAFEERLQQGEFDIIIADYNLHTWTALDALEILKQSGKDIPLIVSTGSLGDEPAVECVKQGAADFVLKDRPARLALAVERALEEKRLRQEREGALTALRKSEAGLAEAQRIAHLGSWESDLTTDALECSDEVYRIFGAGKNQFARTNQAFFEFVHPDDREKVQAASQAAQAGGPPFDIEHRIVRPDGSILCVHEKAEILRDDKGRAIRMVGTVHDITERKRAEQALRASEDRYRDLVEHSHDLICTHDLQGRILSVNETPAASLGLKTDDLLGKNLRDVLAPEVRQGFEAYLEDIQKNGVTQGLMRVHTASGERRIWEYHNTLRTEGVAAPIVRGVAHDVTERLRAEKALRESEARYRVLFERNLAGIVQATLDGEILNCNESFARIFGYSSSQEALGHSLEESWFDPAEREAFIARLQREGALQDVELRVRRRDGRRFWILENLSLVKPTNGGMAIIEATVFDITERKRAEESLRESEARFRRLVESNMMGITIGDDCGLIVYANDAYLGMVGYTREDLATGRLRWDVFTPPDQQHIIETIRRQLNTAGVTEPLETVNLHKDGRRVPVLIGLARLEGVESQAICFAIDLTERKRAEAENARLMTAIEQSPNAVTITDVEGAIQYVNPAFSRITGYSREEVLGKNPRILKSGQHDRAFYERMWQAILGGETWHGELVNRRKDGKLYNEETYIAPVRNSSGEITHFIAIKQDITARKELEEQLRQAQKMEAVGQLAGGVAHDFNNLLTIINGYSQLLLENLGETNALRAQVAEIQKAGERAAGLTQQLLAFSRRQVLNLQVLDLNQVIRDTHKMLHRMIGEDIECHMVLHPELWNIRADPGQIAQIIMNLGVNARDAMPQGGVFTIETSNAELTEAYAATHAEVTPGRYAVLAVSDTGIGMDRETQARIFEPFFTTKEPGKGTGLGLATVYGIVKQSGGHIWVYSEPGKGTTFKVYLPHAEGDGGRGAIPGERRENYRGTETILLVEDEASVRRLVAEVLRSQGYDVLVASNPEEATQISGGYAKAIHLLLTDLVMPRWNGRQLAENLVLSRPEMKVLFMSGYTDDTVVRQGAIQEGTPFLQKPFTPESLVRRVRGVLDSRLTIVD